MKDFAESANRAQGLRWWFALLMVLLLLLGAVWAVWQALLFVLTTWL
jgi:nitrogen fixation/metabolism regulation signal transduction histidine kinase